MAAGLHKVFVDAVVAAPPVPQSGTGVPAPRKPKGQACWLKLPTPGRGLGYRWERWRTRLPALLRPHDLHPQACAHYASRCRLDAALRGRFAALFDLRQGGAPAAAYSFVYAQGAIDLLQARVLADLGVNARHLRLLRHRTQVVTADPSALATAAQDIDCRLVRVVQVGPTDVVALLQTAIADEGGQLLAQLEDAFIVRGLAVACVVQAGVDDLLRRAVSRMRRHERELVAGDAGVRERRLYVAPAAARGFSALAGGPLRLLRGPVAPMLLRHLVARELAEWEVDPGRLQISFLAGVAPGQMLQLLLQGRSLELVDRRGRLVAFGRV